MSKIQIPELLSSVSLDAYIDGTWRKATGDKEFSVDNPSTGEVICHVSDTQPGDWEEALNASVIAFANWSTANSERRSDALRKLHDVATERIDEIGALISLETGKPLKEGLAEAKYGTSFLRWYSELIMAQRGEFEPSPSGEYWMVTTKQPVGPCLLITPWNFPYAMITRKLGAALAAGCTAILKPAAMTPLSCAWLVKLIDEVLDLPNGVVNYIPTTDARNMSSSLMHDPRLRKISFTGSTQVGSALLGQAAEHIQASSMELGGNAPFIVLPSADLKEAVEGAIVAKFRNSGQACVGANRILVHDNIREEFVSRFVDATKQIVVGEWDDEGSELGPIIDENQLKNIEDVIARAQAEGGDVVLGGKRLSRPGTFLEPTVVVDAPVGGQLWSEEIFGPVAAIYSFDNQDDLVALANNTEYGLISYLYGSDDTELLDVANQLQSGMVAVNRPVISEARAPFGGIKASGMGREGGTQGLADYQITKYIALQR